MSHKSLATLIALTVFAIQVSAQSPSVRDPLSEAEEALKKASPIASTNRQVEPVKTTSEAAAALVGTTWGGRLEWDNASVGRWITIGHTSFLLTFAENQRLIAVWGTSEKAYDAKMKREDFACELVRGEGRWEESSPGTFDLVFPEGLHTRRATLRIADIRDDATMVRSLVGDKRPTVDAPTEGRSNERYRIHFEKNVGLYFDRDFYSNNWSFCNPETAKQIPAELKPTVGPLR